MFDMIYVFEDGKIAESGDFNSLLIAGGVFAQMWQSYVSEEPGSTSEKDNLGNLITLRDRIEKRLARNSSEKQESKSAEI